MSTPAAHYDSLRVQSLAERATGETYALKRLHNAFKRELIEKHAANAPFLVDIACGRGGDLNKWRAAGVKRVLGVDVSGAQILEARRRAEGTTGIQVRFDVTPADLAVLRETPPGSADVVTCMFALNYFWGSSDDAFAVIAAASRLLKPGGLFFGVCADGSRVMEFLNPQDPKPLKTGVYELTPRWSGKAEAFGSAYSLVIKDTVLDGKAPANEYLVYWNVLRNIAVISGLEPLTDGFQHIDPASLPSQAMRDISGINGSFVFRKQAESRQHPALRDDDSLVSSD